jgi:hypothetical protein
MEIKKKPRTKTKFNYWMFTITDSNECFDHFVAKLSVMRYLAYQTVADDDGMYKGWIYSDRAINNKYMLGIIPSFNWYSSSPIVKDRMYLESKRLYQLVEVGSLPITGLKRGYTPHTDCQKWINDNLSRISFVASKCPSCSACTIQDISFVNATSIMEGTIPGTNYRADVLVHLEKQEYVAIEIAHTHFTSIKRGFQCEEVRVQTYEMETSVVQTAMDSKNPTHVLETTKTRMSECQSCLRIREEARVRNKLKNEAFELRIQDMDQANQDLKQAFELRIRDMNQANQDLKQANQYHVCNAMKIVRTKMEDKWSGVLQVALDSIYQLFPLHNKLFVPNFPVHNKKDWEQALIDYHPGHYIGNERHHFMCSEITEFLNSLKDHSCLNALNGDDPLFMDVDGVIHTTVMTPALAAAAEEAKRKREDENERNKIEREEKKRAAEEVILVMAAAKEAKKRRREDETERNKIEKEERKRVKDEETATKKEKQRIAKVLCRQHQHQNDELARFYKRGGN